MTCSHCAAAVEKALLGVQGVEEVSVFQASGRVVVKGQADAGMLMQAIDAIGFEAEILG